MRDSLDSEHVPSLPEIYGAITYVGTSKMAGARLELLVTMKETFSDQKCFSDYSLTVESLLK